MKLFENNDLEFYFLTLKTISNLLFWYLVFLYIFLEEIKI